MEFGRVCVYGMAKSGVAAARLLADAGAKVRIADLKTADKLKLDALDTYPDIERRLGETGGKLLDGIDLLVVSPGVPDTNPLVTEAKARGIEVWGELELGARVSKGTLVAITGTNGKTTTTTLVGETLKNAGRAAYVVGNIGLPFCEIADRTKADDVVACEVSSFQMETASAFHPRVSAILNIAEDHLNRHGTMDVYVGLKARVFMNQTAGDTLVLNYDDPVLRALAEKAACRVLYFSRKAELQAGAFVRGDDMLFSEGGETRALCRVSDVALPGAHNLENALAASCVAMALGVPAPVIRHTLRTFQGVEHRIEFVRSVSGVRFVNDSKGTNADSVEKAIDAVKGDMILMLGGSYKAMDYDPLCMKIAACGRVKRAVLIGETAEAIEKSLRKAGFTEITHCGRDFEGAIRTAYDFAKPGDTVLLSPACASFDMFTCFEERGDRFKEIVRGLTEKPV